MDNLALPLAALGLGLLLARGAKIGLPTLAALAFLEWLLKGNWTDGLQVALCGVIAWIPFRAHPEYIDKLFRARRATQLLLFYSLLIVPFSIELLTTAVSIERRLDAALRASFEMITIVPITILLLNAKKNQINRYGRSPAKSRTKILWCLFGLLITAAVFIPLPQAKYHQLPTAFLLFPPLIASAIILSPLHHAANLLLVSSLATLGNAFGGGPFHSITQPFQSLLLHSLLLTLSWSTWILNASETESISIEKNLEKLVESRTHELKSSQVLLDTVFENIPDMIFVKDANTLQFARLNQAGEKLIGIPRESMIGKSDFDYFPPDQAAAFIQADQAVIHSRKVTEIEEPIQTKTGERWLRTKKLPIFDANGRPQFVIGISEDITLKRQADQERLRLIQEEASRKEAEKNLSIRNEFLTIAAHELRTPVSALKLGTELSLKFIQSAPQSKATTHELEQLLKLIQKEAQQLNRLNENLLDVARIQSDRFHVSTQKNVDLSNLISNCIEKARPHLEEAKCTLSVDIHPGITASVDAERISQMTDNLLENAAKFGRGTPVTVRLFSNGSHWILEVSDQGIGMDSETLNRLLRPFERSASYRNFPGLGLGLYISKAIIQAHQGTLQVEGKPSQGARFTLTAPLELGGLGTAA